VKANQWILLPPILAVVASAPALAQQKPQQLTLASALDLAEKQNLDLAAARAQRAIALAGVRIAGARSNPTANVAVLRDSPHESLFFDQPLEVGSKRKRRIELAQEGMLTEASLSTLELQVRRNVRDAYFGLAYARGASAERAGLLKLAERLQDIARSRFNAGDIPQLEVTQAELEVARAGADLQVAEQEEKVALCVPPEAVYRDEAGEPRVFVVNQDSAKAVPVKPGIETEELTELLAGVKEGDTVILTGGYGLGDEAKIQTKAQREQ
jgi:outer membrane protein TolC